MRRDEESVVTGPTSLLHFEVAAALARAQRMTHTQGEALFALGHLNAELGNAAAAQQRWRECLELDPRHARARFQLAAALFAHGDVDEAIEQWRTCLDCAPAELRDTIHLSLAMALQRKGVCADDAAVAAHVKSGTGNSPAQGAGALLHAGVAALLCGSTAAAESAFRKCLLLQPQNGMARAGLAMAMFQLHRYDEALREFKACGDGADDAAATANNMGAVYHTTGQPKQVQLAGVPGDLVARTTLTCVSRRWIYLSTRWRASTARMWAQARRVIWLGRQRFATWAWP